MDKHFLTANKTASPRKGFALIITLSVLAVLIALTGVLIGYLDTARKDASETKALLQANLYFKDIKVMIQKVKDRKTLYGVLYASPLPLQSEDGRFSLVLSCMPKANGVNINWLQYGNSQIMTLQYNAAAKVFDMLMQTYNVENPIRLEEILLESTGGYPSYEREGESRLGQKNGIISYQQFKRILNRYQFETDDENIGRIPWNKYFVFNPVSKVPKENMIIGDYLSAELLSVLFDIDMETLKEEWVPGEGALKRFLNSQGIVYESKLFSKNFTKIAYCEADYDFDGERYRFSFTDEEGEVRNFEFYGKRK
jgi:hypothetical protein